VVYSVIYPDRSAETHLGVLNHGRYRRAIRVPAGVLKGLSSGKARVDVSLRLQLGDRVLHTEKVLSFTVTR